MGRLADRLGALWRGMKQRPWEVVAIVAAFAAGGLAGVPAADSVYQYQWADPRFCDDCHVHDYANAAYERSVHAGLTTCHDCHLVPISHYPWNMYLAIFNRPQGEEDIHPPHVETVVCTRCHSRQTDDEPLTGPMPDWVRKRVVKIDESPLHMRHLKSEVRSPGSYRGGKDEEDSEDEHHTGGDHSTGHGAVRPSWDAGAIACMDCHGAGPNRAHRFEASRDNCVRCHEDTALPGPRLGKASCRECHFAGFIGKPGTSGPAGEAAPTPTPGHQAP